MTMGRPVAALAASISSSSDTNLRGVQIFRIVNSEIRAESISAVSKDGLNTHCAYVVTDPTEKEVYCWLGENCTADNEFFAQSLAWDVVARDLRSLRPVLTLKQLSGTAAVEHLQALTEIIFWQIITGVNPVSVSAELKQKCSVAGCPKNGTLVAMEYTSGSGGQYIPIAEASIEENGRFQLNRGILKPARVVVVECGANSYLWVGPVVAAAVMTNAMDVLRRRISSQPGRVLCQVRSNNEPTVFSRLFINDKETAAVSFFAKFDVKIDPAKVVLPSPVSTDDRPLSVSERMKRFSKVGNATASPALADTPKSENNNNASAVSATSEVVDPATLSVKEKMALFKKAKTTEQPDSKKKPIDMGVDVGMKEKRALMESTLDANKNNLHILDGTGQTRRSSFGPDDNIAGETVTVIAANKLDTPAVELKKEFEDLSVISSVESQSESECPQKHQRSSESMIDFSYSCADTAPAAVEITQPTGAPDANNGSHFEPVLASTNDPLSRMPVLVSNIDGVVTEDTANLTTRVSGGGITSSSLPISGPPHSHKKNITKFEHVPASPIVPITRKSITSAPIENVTTILDKVPGEDSGVNSPLQMKEQQTPATTSVVSNSDPAQMDPVITTGYKSMSTDEISSAVPTEKNSCCVIM